MITADPIQIAKPYLWLAAFAFLVGFLGSLLLSAPAISRAYETHEEPAPVSAPAPEWRAGWLLT